MNRTRATGLLLSLLGATVGCGDEDFVCQLDVCGTGCVNLEADPLHCGQCFNECGTNEACEVGVCMPTELVCEGSEVVCADACVDTQTSTDHCGTCEAPCAAGSDCVAGVCQEFLVAMRTVIESKGDIERDVFVVKLGTLELTQLGNTTFLGSRIIDHAVLPDGRVLLVGAQETDGVFELFLSSPNGGALTKLSGPQIASGLLPGLAVSADGTKVLYRADQDAAGQFELYAVEVANPGVSVKVNGALTKGGQVSRVFSLSATGDRATYIADQELLGVNELYTVDLSAATPGASVKLSTILSTDFDVFDYVTTPDASRVLYRSNETLNGNAQLFVADVATAGTATVVANALQPDYHTLEDYSIAADGLTAIYTGGDSFFSESMWIASLDATPDSAFLAENVNTSDGMVRSSKAIAGGAVYFRKDIAFGNPRLFTVNLATPNVIGEVFDGELMPFGVDRVVVSPNGEHLVFGAGGDGGESGNEFRGTDGPNLFGRSFELYHVDLTATLPAVPTRIVQITTSGRTGIEHDYIVRDDGSVIFRADLDTSGRTEVYVGNPAAPDTTVKISPDLDAVDASDVRQLQAF